MQAPVLWRPQDVGLETETPTGPLGASVHMGPREEKKASWPARQPLETSAWKISNLWDFWVGMIHIGSGSRLQELGKDLQEED